MLHNSFHNDFKEFIPNEWNYYLPKNWIPHCTLAINLSQEMVHKSFKYVHKINLPIELTIEKIGLIEFRPVKEIACYKIL